MNRAFDHNRLYGMHLDVSSAGDVRQLRALHEPAPQAFHGMCGQSAAMIELFRKIRRLARTNVAVLIAGESGTGKAMAARALHDESERRTQPFIAVDCSSWPDDAADADALFASAHGGTLFLFEVGELSVAAQAGLLRRLEFGVTPRASGAFPRDTSAPRAADGRLRTDVRVIATSHRPLDRMVAEGAFNDDLLYRLSVAGVTLPPLRDRSADIPSLVEHFLRLFTVRHHLSMRALDATAERLLERYAWPGNVRELRNAVESALVLADGPVILPKDLPDMVRFRGLARVAPTELAEDVADLPFTEARERALREFDRAFLASALARNGGNVARTARALGIHRQSLQKLLVRRELRPPGEGTHAL